MKDQKKWEWDLSRYVTTLAKLRMLEERWPQHKVIFKHLKEESEADA